MYKKRVPAKSIKIVPRIFRAWIIEDYQSITRAAKEIGLSRGTLHNILDTGRVYELAESRLKAVGIDPFSFRPGFIKKPSKNGAGQ